MPSIDHTQITDLAKLPLKWVPEFPAALAVQRKCTRTTRTPAVPDSLHAPPKTTFLTPTQHDRDPFSPRGGPAPQPTPRSSPLRLYITQCCSDSRAASWQEGPGTPVGWPPCHHLGRYSCSEGCECRQQGRHTMSAEWRHIERALRGAAAHSSEVIALPLSPSHSCVMPSVVWVPRPM